MAVVATGTAVEGLRGALLRRPPETLSTLRAVVASDPEGRLEALVVLGPPDQLPWCDGADYLGRSPEAPGVLLPTVRAPSVPPALLVEALELQQLTALVPVADRVLIVAVDQALALDRMALSQVLDEALG